MRIVEPEVSLPAQTRIVPYGRVQRERLLPRAGVVLVTLGQAVEPATVVAEAEEPGGVHIIEAGAALGLADDQIEGVLLAEPGAVVAVDQPVAAHKRRLRRTREVRSPVAGQVLAVDDRGRLLIEPERGVIRTMAGMHGRVVNIMPRYGAVVEGNGALVQGIWGSGGEALGPLRVLVDDPHEPLPVGWIDASLRGAIVAGGATITRAGLEAAREAQVGGLVLGGMPYDLVEVARTLPFPIMLTESFGWVPMATPILEILFSADGYEAMLDGAYAPRWTRRFPELFVPGVEAAEPVTAPGPLAEGQWVRLVSMPYMGAVGQITRLDAGARPVESGLILSGCEVRLENDEVVFVPYSNLEQIV